MKRSSRLPTVAKKHRRIHPVYAQTCAEHGEGICCAEMRLSAALFPLRCAAGLVLLAGCNTQSQTAVVVSKEFIPAQIIPTAAPPHRGYSLKSVSGFSRSIRGVW